MWNAGADGGHHPGAAADLHDRHQVRGQPGHPARHALLAALRDRRHRRPGRDGGRARPPTPILATYRDYTLDARRRRLVGHGHASTRPSRRPTRACSTSPTRRRSRSSPRAAPDGRRSRRHAASAGSSAASRWAAGGCLRRGLGGRLGGRLRRRLDRLLEGGDEDRHGVCPGRRCRRPGSGRRPCPWARWRRRRCARRGRSRPRGCARSASPCLSPRTSGIFSGPSENTIVIVVPSSTDVPAAGSVLRTWTAARRSPPPGSAP